MGKKKAATRSAAQPPLAEKQLRGLLTGLRVSCKDIPPNNVPALLALLRRALDKAQRLSPDAQGEGSRIKGGFDPSSYPKCSPPCLRLLTVDQHTIVFVHCEPLMREVLGACCCIGLNC